MPITDKMEEVERLFGTLADDIKKLRTLAEVSVPVGEALIQQALERAEEIKDIFKQEAGSGEA